MYTNIASLCFKFLEFAAIVAVNKPSFVMVTETWLTSDIPDSLVSLSGYSLFRRDRQSIRGGGVCIYVSNFVMSNFIVSVVDSDTSNVESLFLKVTGKSLSIVLGCVYRTPSSDFDSDLELFNALTVLANDYNNLLICGDFNMPELNWPLVCSGSLNRSSQLLVDLISDSHLYQMVSEPTRYRKNQCPSVLDLVLSSNPDLIANLEYSSPIGNQMLEKDLLEVDWASTLKYNTISENWEAFKSQLQELTLLNSIRRVFMKSTKKPWINDQLVKMIRIKRNLWRSFKCTGNVVDYGAHRTFSNQLASKIKSAKSSYKAQLARNKNPKSFYKYIRDTLGGSVRKPKLRDSTGALISDNDKIANIFADTFAEAYTAEPSSNPPVVFIPRCTASLTNVEFLEQEVYVTANIRNTLLCIITRPFRNYA
ncbi:hypothetical protein Zmor_015618 [Zophobas morio]|uniref:Endonuclease/exonuclease/phosphatase domain-containing protein n=1 Tax=Zophobas morio TaxID=2755281 RepID=A0AA38IMF2_9CUCU|nr:hypothetical protein Zmor_015618 [Zophobas morio]